MKDFIEVLGILLKYLDEDPHGPFHCEHDVLRICGPHTDEVAPEDLQRLHELGIDWDEEYECWYSFRFGSC